MSEKRERVESIDVLEELKAGTASPRTTLLLRTVYPLATAHTCTYREFLKNSLFFKDGAHQNKDIFERLMNMPREKQIYISNGYWNAPAKHLEAATYYLKIIVISFNIKTKAIHCYIL